MKKKKAIPPKQKFNILVVDDQQSILDFFVRLFKDSCRVSVARSGEDAIALAKNTRYDLAYIDIVLPGINGVETLKQLRGVSPDTIAIMMSGHEVTGLVESALQNGAVEFIPKPFKDLNQILTIKEAAKLLKVSDVTLRRLASNGELPAVKLGKQWRIHQEKLEQWIKNEGQAIMRGKP